jgi:hypothetical protein
MGQPHKASLDLFWRRDESLEESNYGQEASRFKTFQPFQPFKSLKFEAPENGYRS